MKEIIFKASFGKEDKTVKLVQANGSNGSYHIMIDNFYWGMMLNNQNGWQVYFNHPEEFTGADSDVLIEMVVNDLRDSEL